MFLSRDYNDTPFHGYPICKSHRVYSFRNDWTGFVIAALIA